MGEPGFWDDQERAAKVSAEHSRTQRKLDEYRRLESDVDDLEALVELAAEDESMADELREQYASVAARLANLEMERLFSGDYDAGGQHVNKTDSAVRITHTPTGIVVQCLNERSQSSNKATAMAMLRSKLLELEERKRQEELARERGEAQSAEWGNQIRSYVLHPYTMVKDHRTNEEAGDVHRVLDGDLDRFVRAELERRVGSAASGA